MSLSLAEAAIIPGTCTSLTGDAGVYGLGVALMLPRHNTLDPSGGHRHTDVVIPGMPSLCPIIAKIQPSPSALRRSWSPLLPI